MATQVKNQPKKLNTWLVIAGITAIILLIVLPLAVIKDTQFGGADGLGAETVAAIAPQYDSGWTSNIWTPPGPEVESMLFALQAGAGGVLIGYVFGYLRGRNQNNRDRTG